MSSAPATPESTERTPCIVHCKDCRHEWAAFYFPLALDKNGLALMRNAAKHCPMCASTKVYVGAANQGEVQR